MTPENKAKALEIIDECLRMIDFIPTDKFKEGIEELRDLIQPPEEAEEIRRLKARIGELESEAKARSKEIYDLHEHISAFEDAIESLSSELERANDKQLSKEERDRLCDKAWDLTP